jgi:hypothetical protein
MGALGHNLIAALPFARMAGNQAVSRVMTVTIWLEMVVMLSAMWNKAGVALEGRRLQLLLVISVEMESKEDPKLAMMAMWNCWMGATPSVASNLVLFAPISQQIRLVYAGPKKRISRMSSQRSCSETAGIATCLNPNRHSKCSR